MPGRTAGGPKITNLARCHKRSGGQYEGMHALRDALDQAWPPFVLVAGLLLLGLVVARDGWFHWAGERLQRLPGGTPVLLAVALATVAVTTAFLNLDTAVVFLTPVLVLAARHRCVPEAAFLYGAVFMANASSLFLPGSNLTNLLVLGDQPSGGAHFATTMLPGALAACVVTGALLFVLHRRSLRASAMRTTPVLAGAATVDRPHAWLGVAGAAVAAVAMVVLHAPALPVLGLGVACVLVRVAQRRLGPGAAWATVNPPVLAALFAVAVVLGTLARSWAAPGHLVATASAPVTAAVGAGSAILFNNLPASALLASGPVAHTQALLVGLNVGPNLAVTGSLAAFLWARAARSVDAPVSVRAFSRQGIVLAPLAIVASLAASAIFTAGP
jgi:arsenical pump membrane protein